MVNRIGLMTPRYEQAGGADVGDRDVSEPRRALVLAGDGHQDQIGRSRW
jgi:hypothetical protein